MIKAIVIISSLLLVGGIGYSEMPGGNFWVGITEAFGGALILLWLSR